MGREPWRTPAWALIRDARTRAGLTQAELAERAGTSQSAVARYERGRALPTLETLYRLVRACGFDLRMRLEPYDDHDDVLLEEQLARSPEERLRTNDRLVTLANRAQRG